MPTPPSFENKKINKKQQAAQALANSQYEKSTSNFLEVSAQDVNLRESMNSSTSS
tara:strand:+ start:823 stop:987 length:165 start_codon:yes stop_codon:yes gene_type:complete